MTYVFSATDWSAHPDEIGASDAALANGAIRLDFTRPFLPEAMARTAGLDFLSPRERLRLNQIRGNAALTLLPLLDGLVRGATPAELPQPDPRLSDLRQAFAAGFGTPCRVIDPGAAATGLVMTPPMSRALLGLHRLGMARRHMQAAALNARTLEPAFRRLFLDRWLDTVADERRPAWPEGDDVGEAVAGYRRLCHELAETLHSQAHLDLETLEAACGRRLGAQAWEQALVAQRHAYWWTYIGCALADPRSGQTVRRLQPDISVAFDPLIASFG